MPVALMMHETDPREALRDKIGDVSDIEVFHNQILVAVYIRPDKTRSGLILTETSREEDRHQGKVALILKMGPQAFQSSDEWSWPEDIKAGDWIYYRTSDGWSVTVNNDRDRLCRILNDTDVRGRLQHPDQVW